MDSFPVINTERLLLRPFTLDDAKDVQNLANDPKIEETTLFIPYPYPDGLAEEWISTHQAEFENKKQIIWAITSKQNKYLIGSVGLTLRFEFEKAEFGFWIGQKYWNKGYASEALSAVLKFGFEKLNLNKIFAHHFVNNPASGKVMIKNGLKEEGYLREDIIKDYKYIDVKIYGILKSEYFNR